MKETPFYHDDFLMYSLEKLNESSRRKTRVDSPSLPKTIPGSPSLRGWNEYPKVKLSEFRVAMKDTVFEQKYSFRDNYKLLYDQLLEIFDGIIAVKC